MHVLRVFVFSFSFLFRVVWCCYLEATSFDKIGQLGPYMVGLYLLPIELALYYLPEYQQATWMRGYSDTTEDRHT